jgi:hypothetical protein
MVCSHSSLHAFFLLPRIRISFAAEQPEEMHFFITMPQSFMLNMIKVHLGVWRFCAKGFASLPIIVTLSTIN